MKTNKQIIQTAKKHIGQGGKKFRQFCGLPSGAAWCNAFVDYVANECGVSRLYFNSQKITYCPTSIKWCKKNLAEVPLYLAQPADIIYFDWELNGIPNHIGLVVKHKSTSAIYTIEGNTSGGKVAEKTRAAKYVQGVYRVQIPPAQPLKLGIIDEDGSFGYQSTANMQRAFNMEPTGILDRKTLKHLQSMANTTPDAAWGKKTSHAIQTMLKQCGLYKGKIDSSFGPASTKALQAWINMLNADEQPSDPISEPEKPKTKADKIVAKIDEYAYAYKTSKKKYAYKGGHPKLAYKDAIKKYMKKSARISQSDCGYFVSTCVRAAGVSKTFLALRGRKESFPSIPSTLKCVHKGKIPKGLLQAGDIIRYKKKGGGQHTLFYYGNGKIAEAGRGHYFPAIKKDTKKYNKSNVRKSTIQVLRAKG